jgi:hypothetical protein
LYSKDEADDDDDDGLLEVDEVVRPTVSKVSVVVICAQLG